MFDFLKPDIEFHSLFDPVLEFTPIVKASKKLPDWWKKIDKQAFERSYNGVQYSPGNIKKCPGIRDYLLDGFVLPSWTDIFIDPSNESICEHQTSLNLPFLSLHQFAEIVYKPFIPEQGISDMRHLIKIQTPWAIKTKRNISLQVLPAHYFFNENFYCAPGVIDTHNFHTLTLILSIKSKEPFIIPAGTPLAILKPFKRKKFSFKMFKETKKAHKLVQKTSFIGSSKFSSSFIYNNLKINKCPFS